MNESCLAMQKLCKVYGNKQALAGVTLSVEPGEVLALVGPNGSGKTTLMKLVVGLLRPTSGSISIFGKDREMLSGRDRREIGYVAEEPNLYDHMSVRKILNFNRKFYPTWDEDRCLQLISRFNLPLEDRIKDLSRGMKTQLALVLALMPRPRLLVLDEPMEGLDPLRRIEFMNLIFEDTLEKEGRAILISSHYLEELERMADRIAFIYEGSIKRVVPVEQFKGEAKTIRVVFQKEPAEELLSMPGIREVQREGKLGYLITVENNFSAILEACSRYPHFVLDVYHRNLEDLFSDYSEGGVRSER